MSCTIPFRAAVYSELTQENALEANLVIETDGRGELQGYLESDGKLSIPMTGPMVEQAISMILELEAGMNSDRAARFDMPPDPISEATDCDVVLSSVLANPERWIRGAERDLVNYPTQILS